MRTLKSLICCCLVSFTLSAQSSGTVPKNIIFFLADGTGVSHFTAGRTHKGWLEIEKFKQIGLVITHGPENYYVTESAAGATAYASAQKVRDGMVSVSLDSTPRVTVLEAARDNGLRTGVIAVCTITDASPAAFLSHVSARSMHASIAEQISNSNADLLFGGGRRWFLPTASGGRREDGVNLITKMTGNGYTYVSNAEEFRKLDLRNAKKVVGLFTENHMGYAEERVLTVAEMTRTAIEFLSKNGSGFFLFVENEGTDDAGHANLSDRVKTEVAELDNAVEEATKFAQRNPETLIIVTSDHETGGYALNGGSLSNRTVEGAFTTKGHTGTMVPLFATGPGAERFTGIIDNTEVGKILLEFVQARKTH